MYESTLNVEKNNLHLLTYIKSKLIPEIKAIDGISTELEDKFRNYFTLACSDTYRFQINRSVTNAVVEALSLGYKNVYVRELLKVDGDDFFQNVLVNTICMFDNEYDRQSVAKLVDVDKTVCLDGYYNFRMSAVKRKWYDITKLVTDNDFILTDKELITEFLQYLLESMVTKVKEVSVSIERDGFALYGKDGKALNKLQSMAKTIRAEEDAMLNVICLKPDSVTVYSKEKPDKNFCDLMNALFSVEYICVE
ncbi:MAG: hypothetical protein NC332_05040 [Firmicutes bacterium]|nr:hypothetical protein [Bacillota bacterium]